jgi:hypothetical protein
MSLFKTTSIYRKIGPAKAIELLKENPRFSEVFAKCAQALLKEGLVLKVIDMTGSRFAAGFICQFVEQSIDEGRIHCATKTLKLLLKNLPEKDGLKDIVTPVLQKLTKQRATHQVAKLTLLLSQGEKQ